MASEGVFRVSDLVAAADTAFPFAWADAWDRVGLVVGDPFAPVTGVLVTLDATGAAIARARAAGANVLVTHHPPYLERPDVFDFGPGTAGTVTAALASGVAVVSLHTNLDRSPAGADALPLALGLAPVAPLERGTEQIALVTTFVPPEAEATVRAAMARAGAGRLGEYADCAHVGEGTGFFTPLDAATPVVSDGATGVDERRVEMVCPRELASRVVEAARGAHPYEEPVVIASDGVRARGVARHGRVCEWPGGSVDELAARVARAFGTSVRVWGDGERRVERVATANGSGTSLVAAACEAADALVTGEVRYHDALDAVARGLAIVEAGHDTTEWPLVAVLARAVAVVVPVGCPVTEERPSRAWHTVEDA